MNERGLHQNTRAMLNAWKRMNEAAGPEHREPKVRDFTAILGNLFVLQRVDGGIWPFRLAGSALGKALGRDLTDHDFMALWRGRDMPMVTAQLDAVRFGTAPGLIRARGELLSGGSVDIEIALAPLETKSLRPNRILGLYQIVGDDSRLNGRPIWRHQISAVHPPEIQMSSEHLRLVASNH